MLTFAAQLEEALKNIKKYHNCPFGGPLSKDKGWFETMINWPVSVSV